MHRGRGANGIAVLKLSEAWADRRKLSFLGIGTISATSGSWENPLDYGFSHPWGGIFCCMMWHCLCLVIMPRLRVTVTGPAFDESVCSNLSSFSTTTEIYLYRGSLEEEAPLHRFDWVFLLGIPLWLPSHVASTVVVLCVRSTMADFWRHLSGRSE